MKNSSEYLARINKLYNRVAREYGAAASSEITDAVREMVLACLCEYTSQQQAEKILHRLMQEFVDLNEMRVCRPGEIADVIQPALPQADAVSENILLLLRSLYEQADTLTLEELPDKGKKEIKSLLDKLEAVSPFVKARILLRALGIHAFPVNQAKMDMFRAEEAIDPDADAAAVQAFLERNIPAGKTLKMYAALQYYADHRNAAGAEPSRPSRKTKTPKSEKPAKAAPKTVKKKKTKPVS